MSKRIVIALGGNALGNTAAQQLELVSLTAKPIVDLIAAGNEVIIAHGNGPQVGMINLGLSTAAEAGAIKSDMPFPECGAMSQGYIGYHLQNAIGNELTDRQRDCVQLYYGERLTMQEIADELHLTRGTVCKHLQKASARLSHALQYSALGMRAEQSRDR